MNKIKIVSSTKITEVLATCAFGFALISFFSTAIGLNEFAFSGGEAWKGFLLSFCIQGSLLTLNLNMPKFLANIKAFFPNMWKTWWRIVVAFYAAMLLTSSGFSFVFICNLAYGNTYEVDTQAVAMETVTDVINGSRFQISTPYTTQANKLHNKLHEMEGNQVTAPQFAKLSFEYTIKEIEPPSDSPPLDGSKDGVPIMNLSAINNAEIVQSYKEVLAMRKKLNTIKESLLKLDNELRNEISGKSIDRDIKQKILDAQGVTKSLIIEVSAFEEAVNEINNNIKRLQSEIEDHEKKDIENKQKGIPDDENYEGWRGYIKGLKIKYYELQKQDYQAFLQLINTDDNGEKGYLMRCQEILDPIVDSENITALFVESSLALKENTDVSTNDDYRLKRQRLYDAVEFISSRASNVWTYQEFDINYSNFEDLSIAMYGFDNIYEKASQIQLPTQGGSHQDMPIETFAPSATPDSSATPAPSAMPDSSATPNPSTVPNSANNDSNDQWKEKWQNIINELQQTLINVPKKISSINGKDEITIDISAETQKLNKLQRENFSTLSAIEEAKNHLFSLEQHPFKAWFSLLFAFMLDLASLAIGFIVYLRTKK